jgi:hypothetical protein
MAAANITNLASGNTLYTQLVYESPSMKLKADTNDFRSTCAVQNICKGTVLLIEHCLDGDRTMVTKCVSVDSELYNNLYPRNGTIADHAQWVIEVKKKVSKNGFGSIDRCIAMWELTQ